MGGLKAFMPITWVVMWVATLAIAGIWPFAGFFSKDEIIWQIGAMGHAENAQYGSWYSLFWIMALAAALMTAFYMTRLMVMTFHGTNRTGKEEGRHLHEAPAVMWVPLTVLAVLSVFGDRPTWRRRLADNLLLIRAHWLRMPPLMLARHLLTQVWRRGGFKTKEAAARSPR